MTTKEWIKILHECRKERNFTVIDRGIANCNITGELCSDRNCHRMVEDIKTKKFHIMTNIIDDDPSNDITINSVDSMVEAQKFMKEFGEKGMMDKKDMWIREVNK